MLSRRRFLLNSALSAISVPALFNWSPKSAAASSAATVKPKTTPAVATQATSVATPERFGPNPEDILTQQMRQKLEVYERWLPTHLLDKLPKPFAVELACALENQRVMLEMLSDTPEMLQARRLLIPIATRMLRRSVAKDIVSIQTLLGPCDDVFYRGAMGLLEYDSVAARTRKRKCVWNYEFASDLKLIHGLDAEAELCAILAEELSMETDREVLVDIRNSCKKHNCHTSPKEIYKFANDMFERLANDCGRPNDPEANWLVTSPEVMSYITTNDRTYRVAEDDCFSTSFGIQKEGRTRTCTLYKDPLFPVNQMLLGSKHGQYGAGYIYSPYIPLSLTPVVLDPEAFCPRRGVMTRHAKRLVEPKMYATVNCTRLSL